MTNDDMELVRQYAAHQSESAFAALVSRYTNLVYSVALRRVRDPQLAEEITQAVFIILARKAGSLSPATILPGWLYRAACFTSNSALKAEYRRQKHEQEAYMQSKLTEAQTEADWQKMSPFLEEAMLRLSQADRDALVLRFFEGRTMHEVGAVMGASEEAAKKRVNRALDKLQLYFTQRGVSSTTAVIAGAISANSVQAAPVALAKAVTATAITKGATASGSTLTLINGALKLMAWSKMKMAVVVGVGLLLAAAGGTEIYQVHQNSRIGIDYFPRRFWVQAGSATPEKALQSLLWAQNLGYTKTVLNAFTPEQAQYVEAMLDYNNKTEQARSAAMIEELKYITEFRIWKKTILSDNQAVYHLGIYFAGQPKPFYSTFILTNIDGEWKVSSVRKIK
jgi:RNA polymerase sigma factor (sigma-70 family)